MVRGQGRGRDATAAVDQLDSDDCDGGTSTEEPERLVPYISP